jgi:SPP1 gp7 family putative phage head morphogenesis protein
VPSVNELVESEVIRHQLNLLHYSNEAVREMMGILNRADDPLFTELTMRLQELRPSEFAVTRLQSLLASANAMNAAAYAAMGTAMTVELSRFVEYETAYRKMFMEAFTPVGIQIATLSAEQLYAAVMAQPFQGVLLRGALDDLGARRAKIIERTIAQGFVEQLTNDQIIRKLRGTRAAGFADGLMEAPRRDVAAVVQTAISHTAAFVRDRHAEANSDIVKAIKWTSTLDRRTSPICRLRDGKLYTVDHKPVGHSIPWLGGPGAAHWNCRSTGVEIFKSFKELGIAIPEINVAGTRASMDGQVPKDISYIDWLKSKSAAVQDDVLGPVRGKLLRQGGLEPERMYDHRGRFLTLKELRERDATAFDRAGL